MPMTHKLTTILAICVALTLSASVADANPQLRQITDAASAGWSVEGLKATHGDAMEGGKQTSLFVDLRQFVAAAL
ncbi:hypothetical protein N2599_36855 (plasmid) [Rhizobium sullae]|uniref:Uncharacterized protein n=1 Tax=Rhizobium sullae TaxID=50338 RepID=A0ABY5XY86_RHISU|nr:hypothetical protein [Rhizobium sullae]UWU19594.1 hypothetical protein N2599_36855 [Rhizobium sullae]